MTTPSKSVELRTLALIELDGTFVFIISMRIDGMMHLYATTNRAEYEEWIEPLRPHLSQEDAEALEEAKGYLSDESEHGGSYLITGWAALALTAFLANYNYYMENCGLPECWDLPPGQMFATFYIPIENVEQIKATDGQMFDLDVPHDAVHLFKGLDGNHRIAIIFSSGQSLQLAEEFPELAEQIGPEYNTLVCNSLLPADSENEIIVIGGQDTWVESALAVAACLWVGVVRFYSMPEVVITIGPSPEA